MKQKLDALALPLWGSRLIEASAGTGKTWTIAALYLRLVLAHGRASDEEPLDDATGFGRPLAPQQILVMTFTKAATRELSDRIRGRLVEAARCFRGDRTVAVDDELLAGLVAACPAGPARESAAWRLATAAESMDDAAVFTIDAWVQRMLREHAFDSGSLFDEAVQADDNALWNEAARDFWRQEVYPLAVDAVGAVQSVWSDDRVLADDMRVLGRLLPLESNGHESLASIIDAAAARRDALLADLKERWSEPVRAMRRWIHLQFDSSDGPFDTKKLARKRVDAWLDIVERWLHGNQSTVLKMTPDAIHRLSSNGLREVLKPGRIVDVPTSFDALPTLIDTLASMRTPASAMRRHAAARVAAIVQDKKRGAGTYGFDDMLARLDRALAGANGDRLRARIVAQYPVALIDEFQDTSPVQYRILDRLYRTADNDRATALLLIGDPKQSIYRFRGADIHSYLRAREAVAGRHYFLTTNYRATVPLVAAINHLFGQAELRGEARDDGAFRFGPGETSPVPFVAVDARGRTDTYVDAEGPVAAMTLCHDPELSSKSDARARFAERCAEHIAVSLADPSIGFVQPGEPFRRLGPADITVLVRDRDEAYAMRRALRRRNVASAYLSDQDSVFSSDEAADLVRWLRAVADPMDARAARIAFATKLIDLPIAELTATSRDEAVFEERLDALKRLNGEWRRLGVLPMLRRSLHLLRLSSRWLAKDDGDRRLTNYLHLAELLQTASARLDGELALIRWLVEEIAASAQRATRADEQVVRLESDAELVKVATVHVAKGLEYPIVYLPFACSYREPKWKAGDFVKLAGRDGVPTIRFDPDADDRRSAELEERQEDLRLLYVAMTRARHALWIGVASLKAGKASRCGFARSAFGYLLCGDQAVTEHEILGRLHATFDGLVGVDIVSIDGPGPRTRRGSRLESRRGAPSLVDAPVYAATFERDWSIGSFSSLVRDLARVPLAAVPVAPEVEEELLSGPEDPIEHEVAPPSNAPRHRFPRGTLPGNFLHDQLEWLADQRFATTDPIVRDQLMRRCERQGWGARATDVATWMNEVATTALPPIGLALNALPRVLPEMEFWFPSERLAARYIDDLCRRHLLDGRDRPALPERTLRGMLMGFADLVFEVDGRYWVLDYKSNALGPDDAAYSAEAIAASMAQHRYDVQAAVYLLALHRLLKQRLGDRYDPARDLGGALYFFIRGLDGPTRGCHVVAADPDFVDALDEAFETDPSSAPA